MRKLLALLFVLALTAPASAYLVDFDGPIPAGVTVEYFDGGMVAGVTVLPVPNAVPLTLSPFGSTVPGDGEALMTYRSTADFGPYGVLVTYAMPQRFVSAVGNDFGGDPVNDNEVVYLSAFDSAKTFLGSSSFSGPFAEFHDIKPVSFTSLSENIKYVAFTWTTDLGYYAVDNINNCPCPPAPIPGSLLLLGTGILGLVGIGIRKKSS